MRLYHYGDLNGGALLDAILPPDVPVQHAVKPRYSHVLWASPVASDYGWEEWCADESFGDLPHKRRWELMLLPHARILTIDTFHDLTVAREQYACARCAHLEFLTCLDWARLARDFDAVYLTEEGQWRTRMSAPSLYGWDCESVAIFRASTVVRLET